MARVLIVIHAIADIRHALRLRVLRLAADDELAVCLVHDTDSSGVGYLALQQQMTVELRASLGLVAESAVTFVVSGRSGDDVAACARAWEATVVENLVPPPDA
jgi:hypothetical protein